MDRRLSGTNDKPWRWLIESDGRPTYTLDGKNVVILQGFKEYFALGFFKGALLKDPKHLLVQLGQTQAARVIRFTSVTFAYARTIAGAG